ncbi:hypothetical protein HIM_10120 [Hirsutella minnesotensis 3608]|uniref:HTH psq-type domain-containing protein n=1 Tax=Hirsutella minnesotensis 3608 TaxID=1043627 RepID=A0A0F7ZG93_9HYPO|nr:hypothetical protein HIM_10120 [Hirsutella minnesotensis 3608]
MTPPNVCRENDIKNAVIAVQEGDTIAHAARDWSLPRSTLRRRLEGAVPMQAAIENLQRLSPRQEQELAEWILAEEIAGRPPTKREVTAFAQHIASLGSIDRPISKH